MSCLVLSCLGNFGIWQCRSLCRSFFLFFFFFPFDVVKLADTRNVVLGFMPFHAWEKKKKSPLATKKHHKVSNRKNKNISSLSCDPGQDRRGSSRPLADRALPTRRNGCFFFPSSASLDVKTRTIIMAGILTRTLQHFHDFIICSDSLFISRQYKKREPCES